MSKGVLVAHNKLEANLQDQRGQGGHGAIPLSAGMLLVTLGVVYGDIGTSPMYTMKSIVANNGGIGTVSEDMILGALSLVIWTMTLVTTVKYVVIAMKADNHNEGGIPFEVRLEQPNKETVAAMLEAERIAKDPSVKGYNDLDELFADLKR